MKSFRAIRRGAKGTVSAIGANAFGNHFEESPLEVVLAAITEQKHVPEGAAHPFYWKPKLRIPDTYENEENGRAFGRFLNACLNATREEQVLEKMSRLGHAAIKGFGPAVANIVYFLHPTLVPPCNTAIMKGFNVLFGADHKLGSWESYLAMREAIVRANDNQPALSKDLGAFAGLLFEIGSNRMVLSGNADGVLEELQAKAAKASKEAPRTGACRRQAGIAAHPGAAHAHSHRQGAGVRHVRCAQRPRPGLPRRSIFGPDDPGAARHGPA